MDARVLVIHAKGLALHLHRDAQTLGHCLARRPVSESAFLSAPQAETKKPAMKRAWLGITAR
jgi:hypothetical protein